MDLLSATKTAHGRAPLAIRVVLYQGRLPYRCPLKGSEDISLILKSFFVLSLGLAYSKIAVKWPHLGVTSNVTCNFQVERFVRHQEKLRVDKTNLISAFCFLLQMDIIIADNSAKQFDAFDSFC